MITWAEEYDTFYHTNLETKDLVDHEYLGMVAKYNYRVIAGLDEGLLPYDLSARGDQVMSVIKPGQADPCRHRPAAATRFAAAGPVPRRRLAVGAAQGRDARQQGRDRQPGARRAREGHQHDLHEPRLLGLHRLSARAGGHRLDVPDAGDHRGPAGNIARAQQMITWWVGINWYSTSTARRSARDDLVRHDPDYEHVTWGAMGTPPLTVDCIDEWIAR